MNLVLGVQDAEKKPYTIEKVRSKRDEQSQRKIAQHMASDPLYAAFGPAYLRMSAHTNKC